MLNSQFWAAIAILAGLSAIIMGIMVINGVRAVRVPLMINLLFILLWMFFEPKR